MTGSLITDLWIRRLTTWAACGMVKSMPFIMGMARWEEQTDHHDLICVMPRQQKTEPDFPYIDQYLCPLGI